MTFPRDIIRYQLNFGEYNSKQMTGIIGPYIFEKFRGFSSHFSPGNCKGTSLQPELHSHRASPMGNQASVTETHDGLFETVFLGEDNHLSTNLDKRSRRL